MIMHRVFHTIDVMMLLPTDHLLAAAPATVLMQMINLVAML